MDSNQQTVPKENVHHTEVCKVFKDTTVELMATCKISNSQVYTFRFLIQTLS